MISGLGEEGFSKSIEDLKADFKNALVGARRISLFDKAHQNGKLHLHEIVDLVAQKILSEEGHKKPRGKYGQVIHHSLSGLESCIRRVLPVADAQEATRIFFLSAKNAKSSSECIERGVQGVVKYIEGVDSPPQIQSVYKKSGASKLKMQTASQSWGNYIFGLGQIVLGGSLALSGGIIELGSFGTLTIGAVPAIAAGCALMSSGAALSISNAQHISMENRSGPSDPDPSAKGRPHTVIEKPGPEGQYTTHNGDGTFSQYRGSGKPHGNTPRLNVKENQIEQSPTGPIPGKSKVREARPEEIPGGSNEAN
jgi:hypothetical protein